jgi:hypothetical protein
LLHCERKVRPIVEICQPGKQQLRRNHNPTCNRLPAQTR